MQGDNKGKELDGLSLHEALEAAPQVPLPLEDDTSATLEEAAAEPTFRDLPIAWENVTTEENGKQRTGHWIVWNGNRSKREEFFMLAFPDQYNKVMAGRLDVLMGGELRSQHHKGLVLQILQHHTLPSR